MQTDYDIVIVGGGLAGNCLALALQKKTTLRIAIIEAQTNTELETATLGDRALALAASTVEVLKNLDIWQGVAECATTIENIHVSDKGHFGKVRLSAKKENVAALGYVITARDLESHVMRLIAKSSVTRICPARLVGLIANDYAAFVNVKQNEESLNLSTKLVIGADGGNSSVRNLLKIQQQHVDYQQTALVTTITSSLPHKNTAYERFTASGPLALLPMNDNKSAVVWTRTHEEAQALMHGGESDFLHALQDCFGYRLGELQLAAPRRAFPLSLIRTEKLIAPRTVIIGNAAHQLHPVAGQGFNLGLRDLIVLAEFLIEQTTRGDIGDAAFLQRYEQARLTDQRKTIEFTNILVQIFSTNWLALAAPRNFGLILLDQIPFAKTQLAQHAMGFSALKNNVFSITSEAL